MSLAILGDPEEENAVQQAAALLEARGIAVDFLPYDTSHSEELDGYDLLYSRKVNRQTMETLKNADETGIEAVNGLRTHMMASHHPAAYYHASSAGVEVPRWSKTGDIGGETIVKPRNEVSCVDPVLDGRPEAESVLHQELIPNPGIDYKVYVDNIGDTDIYGAVKDSKLFSDSDERQQFEPGEELQGTAELAADALDARLLGIDFVQDREEERFWAVDFNSNPSFRGTRAGEELADGFEQLHSAAASRAGQVP